MVNNKIMAVMLILMIMIATIANAANIMIMNKETKLLIRTGIISYC